VKRKVKQRIVEALHTSHRGRNDYYHDYVRTLKEGGDTWLIRLGAKRSREVKKMKSFSKKRGGKIARGFLGQNQKLKVVRGGEGRGKAKGEREGKGKGVSRTRLKREIIKPGSGRAGREKNEEGGL